MYYNIFINPKRSSQRARQLEETKTKQQQNDDDDDDDDRKIEERKKNLFSN